VKASQLPACFVNLRSSTRHHARGGTYQAPFRTPPDADRSRTCAGRLADGLEVKLGAAGRTSGSPAAARTGSRVSGRPEPSCSSRHRGPVCRSSGGADHAAVEGARAQGRMQPARGRHTALQPWKLRSAWWGLMVVKGCMWDTSPLVHTMPQGALAFAACRVVCCTS
jgi:hypothetical protein